MPTRFEEKPSKRSRSFRMIDDSAAVTKRKFAMEEKRQLDIISEQRRHEAAQKRLEERRL